MKNIGDIRRGETYKNLKEKLAKYGKCAVVRPTGFGKTGILTRLLKEYKNVLFLYPNLTVENSVYNFYGSKDIPNTTFWTFKTLLGKTEKDYEKLGNIDIIMVDECHKLGAEGTFKALHDLLDYFKGVPFVGATATPDRMDIVDEIYEFFDDIVVYEYTLHDAFEDGILKRPHYVFCSYGVSDINEVEKECRLEVEKMDSGREEALTLLRSRLIEISNLSRMDNIIKGTCDKYVRDTSYLKFIVFFANFKHIADKGKEVQEWFQNAYPNHEVNIMKVTTESKELSENADKLDTLVYKPNHIDLIYCVDKLNLGYHVNDLTGIVMYRGTASGIIYSQQLGRALSSGAEDAAIVFDVVDNIHRESVYSVLGKKSRVSIENKAKREELLKKLEDGTITEKEKKQLTVLTRTMKGVRWWTHANDLMPEDLIATGYEATYRELIAKTVAEPIAMRCRQAWTRWKEQGGDDSVKTREAILAKLPPEFVPLEPFCRLKCVTVNQVLDEMGIK